MKKWTISKFGKQDVLMHDGCISGISLLEIAAKLNRLDELEQKLLQHVVSGKRPTEGEIVETICPECNGTGRQKHITRTFLTSACRECEGEGKIVYRYDAACASGAVDKTVSDGNKLEEPKMYNAGYKKGMENHEG